MTGTRGRRRRRRLLVVALGGLAWYVRWRRSTPAGPALALAPEPDPAVGYRPPSPSAAAVPERPGAVPQPPALRRIGAAAGPPAGGTDVAPDVAPGAAAGDTVVGAVPADPPAAGTPAQPDGSAPGPDYTIKGNASSMLFHPPTSPYYSRTKAEVWFRTPQEARAAGFTEWTPRGRAAR